MLVELEKLINICNELKRNGKVIVFTNGCFDIIHSGHCYYLNEAKKLGDVLIVGLNSDYSVKRIKGKSRPLNSQEDRAYVLSCLKPVDYVVIFDEDTPANLIDAILPDVLVKGGDYTIDKIVGAQTVLSNGGKVITIPYQQGKSTSLLIEKIRNL